MARTPIQGFDGHLLRMTREQASLSRPDLAREIGVTDQSLKMWEIGGVSPSPKVYVRLTDYFGKDRWFFAPVPVSERTLLDYRQRAGISSPELSRCLGVPVARIRTIEDGERPTLTADQIARWAHEIGISVAGWYQVHLQREVGAMSA